MNSWAQRVDWAFVSIEHIEWEAMAGEIRDTVSLEPIDEVLTAPIP